MTELCADTQAPSWLPRGRVMKYDHLPFQRQPGKEQRDIGVLRHLPRLAAFQIRVKHETALIITFQQHRARQRTRIRPGGGQAHGVWLDDPRVHRLLKPKRELIERACLQAAQVQCSAGVFRAGFNFHVVVNYPDVLVKRCPGTPKSQRRSRASHRAGKEMTASPLVPTVQIYCPVFVRAYMYNVNDG